MDTCQPLSQVTMSPTSVIEFNKKRNQKSGSELTLQAQRNAGILPACIGSLEVFIHRARDIQNICIYHKQDVYAKLCLTSDPDAAVSTKIVNGGGRNPVFDENLRLDVQTIDSSLKCEVWMLSRVKNYLEDQLLGFALVPLSEIVGNGKLALEFSLSSTDLFHSPAGFVQLSLSYKGSTPEVMDFAAPTTKLPALLDAASAAADDDDNITSEYVKLEFPDLNVVNENKMMVSEYFGIPCSNSDSPTGDSFISGSDEDFPDNDAGVKIVESFLTAENGAPLSSVSPDASSMVTHASSQAVSDPLGTNESPTPMNREIEVAEGDTGSSVDTPEKSYVQPIIKVDIAPEQPVVQQEIVDMYLKSMQQFTESLANMKLPMDVESSSSCGESIVENGGASSEKKMSTPKSSGARVFYGSRAFF